MTGDANTPSRLAHLTPHFWGIAVVFFVGGDLVTTGVGLSNARIAELGPITALAYQQYGFVILIPLKLAVMAGAYVGWRLVPGPHNLGIPLGLAAVGVMATLWNLSILIGVFA